MDDETIEVGMKPRVATGGGRASTWKVDDETIEVGMNPASHGRGGRASTGRRGAAPLRGATGR